jgi:hypothetical protein
MKTVIPFLALIFTLSFGLTLSAQDKSYKDGSVWQVGFIKVGANMNVEYLNNLKNNWKATHDEAVKQGLIVSYKILQGAAANPEDWDIMLMTEFKNLAAMEGTGKKKAVSKDEAVFFIFAIQTPKTSL